ncbi:NUDIX domain-containing protein [Lactobacillus apis]|uniref:NUDIX domain-containing protein n=1 Tax=Lactobacillus apis TaxID=303541 RepID=UPI0024300083|nr:NUDIX domain-containing protein [Lactobacillus apis]
MRARVVLYNPELKAILLIHRLKNERDYWVIPGSGTKNWETPIETTIREINEELKIKLLPEKLKQLIEIDDEVFFLTQTGQTKAPQISGEEKNARALKIFTSRLGLA